MKHAQTIHHIPEISLVGIELRVTEISEKYGTNECELETWTDYLTYGLEISEKKENQEIKFAGIELNKEQATALRDDLNTWLGDTK